MSDRKNSEQAGGARKTTLVSVLAALLVTPAAIRAEGVGVVAGAYNGYRNLALTYQTAPLWQATLAARPLEVDLEYALGMVRGSGDSHRDLAHIGVTPFARWRFAENTGVELGVGAHVFSGTRLGEKDLSTAFQFGSSLGVFHRVQGTPWVLGLRLTHYSNADIKRPNPGQDYVQFRASYVFR